MDGLRCGDSKFVRASPELSAKDYPQLLSRFNIHEQTGIICLTPLVCNILSSQRTEWTDATYEETKYVNEAYSHGSLCCLNVDRNDSIRLRERRREKLQS